MILRAIAKEPNDRYATAGELATDLRAWLDLLPINARRISLPSRAWRWCRRHPGKSVAWGVAAVAIAVGRDRKSVV